jgi:hypothetical protein
MRIRIIIAAVMIFGASSLFGQDPATPAPAATEVIARMLSRNVQRETAAGGYTGSRQYVFDNGRFNKHARMVVDVTCDRDGTKHFQVVSEEGWKSANNHVLRKMLESESETSQPPERPKTQITPDNYAFQMVGTALLDGRLAYVIDATPKRDDALLIRGTVWVDAEDYALVRVEGQPAKNPSFWVHSVHFTQQYRKCGAYWFPELTTSISDARIFGKTEVSIRYFDYYPRTRQVREAPDPSLAEASYVKH